MMAIRMSNVRDEFETVQQSDAKRCINEEAETSKSEARSRLLGGCLHELVQVEEGRQA